MKSKTHSNMDDYPTIGTHPTAYYKKINQEIYHLIEKNFNHIINLKNNQDALDLLCKEWLHQDLDYDSFTRLKHKLINKMRTNLKSHIESKSNYIFKNGKIYNTTANEHKISMNDRIAQFETIYHTNLNTYLSYYFNHFDIYRYGDEIGLPYYVQDWIYIIQNYTDLEQQTRLELSQDETRVKYLINNHIFNKTTLYARNVMYLTKDALKRSAYDSLTHFRPRMKLRLLSATSKQEQTNYVSIIENVLKTANIVQLKDMKHNDHLTDNYGDITDFSNTINILQRLVTLQSTQYAYEDKLKQAVDRQIEHHESLDTDQIKALKGLASSNVSILTGEAGTGKTFTIQAFINACHEVGLEVFGTTLANLALINLNQNDLIRKDHLLNVAKIKYHFYNYNTNLIRKASRDRDSVIIIDEYTMINEIDYTTLLSCIPDNCRVIFVGDLNQLPAFNGYSFAYDLDCLNQKYNFIPQYNLAIQHRQQSNSRLHEFDKHTRNYHNDDIDDQLMSLTEIINDPDSCVDWCHDTSLSRLESQIVEDYAEFVKTDPQSNIKIITPLNYQVDMINSKIAKIMHKLQPDFVPNINYQNKNTLGIRLHDKKNDKLHVGDRIVFTQNITNAQGCNIEFVNPTRSFDLIPNGATGVITDIYPNKKLKAQNYAMNDINIKIKIYIDIYDTEVIISRLPSTDCINFGYATTVHKSQGQSVDTILMLIPKGSPEFISKNMLYTGFTRGKTNLKLYSQSSSWMRTNLQNDAYALAVPLMPKLVEYGYIELPNNK